jgi:hypothetical protein
MATMTHTTNGQIRELTREGGVLGSVPITGDGCKNMLVFPMFLRDFTRMA